jgi:hypothetical protein
MSQGYEHLQGEITDHSDHTESVTPPRKYGRGASTSDAAQRGSTRAPLTEPMPVTPYGDLERDSR